MDVFWIQLSFSTTHNKFFACFHAAQIKEAILNGVSLEDDKRDQFNKIEQVSFKLLFHFEVSCCNRQPVRFSFLFSFLSLTIEFHVVYRDNCI